MPLKGLTPGTFASFPSPKPIVSGGGSNLKSAQQGVATIADTSSSQIVPITPVNTSNSIVIINLDPNGTGVPNSYDVSGKLSSSTSLLLSRIGTSGARSISWQVIELSGLKNLQSGTKSLTTITSTQSITRVNLSKSFLMYSFTSNDSTNGGISFFFAQAYLSDNQTIFFNSGGSSTFTIEWYVVEFN